MVQKVEKNIDSWSSKRLSLAGKFQICSKVLALTHVYYSSCWVSSKTCYQKLNRLLRDFIWASDAHKRGFHRVAWDVCCLPRAVEGMGMFNSHFQGFALHAKWILRALQGEEAWKILICHCLSTGLPLGKKVCKGLNLQTILTTLVPIKISGSFVVKSIWTA